MEISNEELLRRCRKGDIDAFGELVRRHEGWLRGWLRSRLRDWTAADDLAQDAFVTAFKKIGDFRGDSSFETWLRGIAMNHFRNFIRKRREDCVGGVEELQGLMFQEVSEDGMSGSESLEALKECMDKVDGPSRDLLNARYAMGKTVREIEKETGRGYSALTMQLHRLRSSLADCVQQTLQAWQT
ncbi:RNA polymerase sigma factor [Haloferula sp.]|uniref:RNA polymerase sigma factor n=1 Tax=Haloferula sp. TaxID=2497595 RepID=UPI00329BEE6F